MNIPEGDERLNLSRKLRNRRIWASAKAVSRGEALQSPIVVDLDLTTFCDLACPECISRPLLNRTRFSEERLVSLAEEMAEAGVLGVVLIGGGEPLVHPAAGRVIESFGRRGLSIGIVTNGTRINRHLGPIAKHANWVRASVDAGTSETYTLFRPTRSRKSQFERVIANLELLAAIKQGTLGYSFLLQTRGLKTNYDDVYPAALLAKSIGCDYFELKAMLDMRHRIVAQSEGVLRRLRKDIERIRTLETSTFRVVYASTLVSLLDGTSNSTKNYDRCRVAELRTTITPDGVFVCAYHRGALEMKIGSLSNQSFLSMWRSANRAIVNPSIDCAFHCARHEMNLELQRMGREVLENGRVFDGEDVFL